MNEQEKHWLVREKTIRLLWRGGIAMLFLLVMADFFIHAHPYFQIDGTFGFFSWFALVTCISMVLFAKALGLLLKRLGLRRRCELDRRATVGLLAIV